jgi:hypothetical protein
MKPQSRGAGLQIPWIPIAVLVAIVAVIGAVIYLVIQAGKPAGEAFANSQAYEMDLQEGKPGEYVNLPEAWGDGTTQAHYGANDGPNTNSHVTHDVDYSSEFSASSPDGLPPAGGPHWGASNCGPDPATAPSFCGPAPWGVYLDEGWAAETLVHNMEHGGVVVWFNTTNQEVIGKLQELVTQRLKDGYFIVMTPYPDVPADTIWLTSWSRRQKIDVSAYDDDTVDDFIKTFQCAFNPEKFPNCGGH